jgi:hypothetical protein
LPVNRYYTNSELETAQDCYRHWYLGYYLRLELARERLIPPRFRGTLVHSGLAVHYETGNNPLDYMRAEGIRIRSDYVAKVDQVDEEELAELDKVIDLALIMVEGYLEWVSEEGVDQDLEFIASEDEVRYHLGDRWPEWEGIHLVGKLDERFRRRSDRFTFFMDHKTVGDLLQLPKWAQINTQLLMYNLILRLTTDEVVDGGVLNMLRTVKRTARANPPFYGRHDVRHNNAQLNNFLKHTLSKIQTLEEKRIKLGNGADHHEVCPPRPSNECAWKCEFFRMCPMMDDGSDWQGLMGEAYREGDPLERYLSLEKG